MKAEYHQPAPYAARTLERADHVAGGRVWFDVSGRGCAESTIPVKSMTPSSPGWAKARHADADTMVTGVHRLSMAAMP